MLHSDRSGSGAGGPTDTGRCGGLAYTLWLAPKPRADGAGIVVVHGAGSRKENHHDYARAAQAAGFAAICFDQRGHGDSDGPMGAEAGEDVAAIAELLRGRIGGRPPIALRGSSMGGYLALVSARLLDAAAIVAICPAGSERLRAGLAAQAYGFSADARAFDAFLAANDMFVAADVLSAPVLILHAEGDESVPVAQSRALAQRTRAPGSKLLVLPGGDHRSIQHDPKLQALSLRFVEDALA